MVGSMFLAGAVCSGIMSAEGCRAVRVGSRLVAKANTFAPALLDSDAVCGRRGKKRVVWVGLIAVTVHVPDAFIWLVLSERPHDALEGLNSVTPS